MTLPSTSWARRPSPYRRRPQDPVSMLPEQTAAVATAACVVEPASGGLQHAAAVAPQCANCGAAVTGKYCSNCGQRLEHEIHSVLHFTREVTEDLTHADSRV